MATTTHDWRHDRRAGPADRRAISRAPHERYETHTERYAAAAPAARYGHVAALREPSTAGIQVSWGGIWGGVLTAVGILLLLAALGVAIGVTAADPASADASTITTATGIWGAGSLLIALFIGGLVATRIGATFDRGTAFWEGGLVWVISLVLMAYLATSGISNLAGTAFTALGGPQRVQQETQAQGGPSGVVDQLKQRVEGAAASGELQQRAAEVQPTATRAAWMTFGGLVISLLASLLGAMAGRRRHLPSTTERVVRD